MKKIIPKIFGAALNLLAWIHPKSAGRRGFPALLQTVSDAGHRQTKRLLRHRGSVYDRQRGRERARVPLGEW